MREIIVIMELIILILIKVQASDPLQNPSDDHLHNNVHSPLTTCLDTGLESCQEKKKTIATNWICRRLHYYCICELFQ